jgi:hypothetical protein
MDTEEDYAYDEWISRLYSEFAQDVLAGRDDLFGEVVDQFAQERLQSFYVDHPDVAEPALWALNESRALMADHPSAALAMAVTSIEVGLKTTLLKPILHGLVHAEFAGALVADLALDHRQDRFQKLVFAILKDYGRIDLATYKRSGSEKTLWEEIADAQKQRNVVVHRGLQAPDGAAARAADVAAHILEGVFPGVLGALSLHTHGTQLRVCAQRH